MNGLKILNLGLAFLIEVVMLLAFGYWGYHTHGNGILRIGLGLGVPLLAAILWGIFAAPKSSRRLQQPQLIIFKSVLFVLAVAALYSAGKHTSALMFLVIAALNQMFALLWHQEDVK